MFLSQRAMRRVLRLAGAAARPSPPLARDTVRAMSKENVEAARRWVELFNDPSDVDEFLSLLDPAVEMQTPAGARLRGQAEVRRWYQDDYDHVRPRIIPDRFVGEGDVVVGLGALELTWVESGETIHQGESAGVYWFRDGKIIRWQPFETHAAALEAAGLPE